MSIFAKKLLINNEINVIKLSSFAYLITVWIVFSNLLKGFDDDERQLQRLISSYRLPVLRIVWSFEIIYVISSSFPFHVGESSYLIVLPKGPFSL